MARPRKSTAEKLSKRLPHVRVTEGEFSKIAANAAQAGLNDNLSDYVRQAALHGRVVVFSDGKKTQVAQDALFELAYQIKKIGVNFNQLVRELHEGDAPGEEMWQALGAIDAKLTTALDILLNDSARSR